MSGKVNLDRWGPHLLAAKREGKSLTQYARSRGLSRHTLYAARQMLRSMGGKAGVERRPRALRAANKAAMPQSAFAAVKLLAPSNPSGRSAAQLRAQLPNGVKLELTWADAPLLAAAIQALAGR
jgi:DNA-binding CsgD family transcriptional regulator